ncbi:hypothetical protein DYB36_002836 [Aphanomyces astaci]|uniref:Ras-GAP domain-containing protein n=1 Tax=Aphanomyces astaci TaxID=112090 RepID=A0A397AQ88_APHAT|nr:hypothetical protein DYB36_002836 [Aphanomyces astaci]
MLEIHFFNWVFGATETYYYSSISTCWTTLILHSTTGWCGRIRRRSATAMPAAATAPADRNESSSSSACISPFDDIPQLKTFERVVKIELDNVHGCEEQFLRSSTGLSSEMKDLGHKYGQTYFSFVLGGALCSSSRLGDLNRDEVMALATDIVHRMVSSLDKYAPYILRLACAYILREFEVAFPNSTRGTTIVVGGCLILRLICPTLIKPELMGFEAHTPHTLPNAILLAKLLQHAMRGTHFDVASDDMYYANEFVSKTKDLVSAYLGAFPSTLKTSSSLDKLEANDQDSEVRAGDRPYLEPPALHRWTSGSISWHSKSPNHLHASSFETSPKRRFSLRNLFKPRSSEQQQQLRTPPTSSITSSPPLSPAYRCRHCGK